MSLFGDVTSAVGDLAGAAVSMETGNVFGAIQGLEKGATEIAKGLGDLMGMGASPQMAEKIMAALLKQMMGEGGSQGAGQAADPLGMNGGGIDQMVNQVLQELQQGAA